MQTALVRTHSPFLYFPAERLSLAELCAARLDGDLVEVGDGYTPADTIETMPLRAGSLAPLLADSLALTHTSAAWVYGALLDPPCLHHVQRAVPQRISHVVGARLCYHDSPLPSRDLVHVGGVRVTNVVRTLFDLARHPNPDMEPAARALAELHPGDAKLALLRVENSARFSGKRAAQRILSAAIRML